jgi:hypothetical protein
MDLGAFLEPGVYPVYRILGDREREPWGHILYRPGRQPTWLSQGEPPIDTFLCLVMDLPDYKLDQNGCLCPALGETAPLLLAGEVARSRVWAERAMFVLRFKPLLRLLDE